MLLTRFDRDVFDSAANSTTFFTVSPSALYNGVASHRVLEKQPRRALMHMEVSVMAQAASLETAEHGLPGETRF